MDAAPEFVAVERKVEKGGGRDGLRAFTGTIPDYGTEVEGLLLSGVVVAVLKRQEVSERV